MSYIPMSKTEFEALLVKEFPNLYVDMHGNPYHTCMAWGIETGPGWYDLIYDLSSKLEKLILQLPEEERQYCKASQCKEKFGTGRFYMSSETDEMSNLISEWEDKTAITCDECGKEGKIRGRGWIYTACDEHTKPNDLKPNPTEE